MFYQNCFNNTVISRILFDEVATSEKEKNLHLFVNSAEKLYDDFCDNIYYLFMNKDNNDRNTLYLNINGSSYVDFNHRSSDTGAIAVLSINKYSPGSPDIVMYIEAALKHFVDYVNSLKNDQKIS